MISSTRSSTRLLKRSTKPERVHPALSELGLTESDDVATRTVAKKVIELEGQSEPDPERLMIATLAALRT
jgi:hypothetical protein